MQGGNPRQSTVILLSWGTRLEFKAVARIWRADTKEEGAVQRKTPRRLLRSSFDCIAETPRGRAQNGALWAEQFPEFKRAGWHTCSELPEWRVIHLEHAVETPGGSHFGSRAKLAQREDYTKRTRTSLITRLKRLNMIPKVTTTSQKSLHALEETTKFNTPQWRINKNYYTWKETGKCEP